MLEAAWYPHRAGSQWSAASLCERQHVRVRPVRGLAAGTGGVLLPLVWSVGEALAGAMGPYLPLRIVSFDLATAPAIGAIRPAPAAKPAWRTTFGSEIRNEPKQRVPVLSLDADVVLLQGLTSAREARRLFPAREWRLVISRQLLEGADAGGSIPRDVTARVPTTAVAVRYQPGLRVGGQSHLMDGAAGGPEETPAVAATGVRLVVEGRVVWVVSAVLRPGCDDGMDRCPEGRALADWRAERRNAGEQSIAGGLIGAAGSSLRGEASTESSPDGVAPQCVRQTISSDEAQSGSAEVVREFHPLAGCLARLAIGR